MHRSLRSILIAAAFAVTALFATTALAAPAEWQGVDVTLHAEQSGSVLLVSGVLPEATPLPAEAELAVPAGAELQWIGEILGGPASEDLALKYTKTTVDGLDVYRFTLTNARTAQIEIPKPGPLFDGTSYTSSFKWASSQDLPEVRLRLRVPEGAQVATTAPGAAMEPGPDGYAFYTKTVKNVKAGEELSLALSYTAPVAAAPAAGAAAAANSEPPVLGIFLAIIAGAAIALFLVSRRKTRPVSEADDDGSDRSDAAATDETSPPTSQSGTGGASKRKLVTAGVIAVLIGGAIVVGGQSTKPKMTGDTVTEVFAQGDPCVTSTFVVAAPQGSDPGTTAKKLFDALRPMTGLNTATFDAKTSSVAVGFCESKTTESAVRDALMPTGLITGEGGGGTAAP